MFIFDEELGIFFRRSKAVGTDLEPYEKNGMLIVNQIDAAELSPGQFSHQVSRCVDDQSVALVVIDSLNGYYAAMPGSARSLFTFMSSCYTSTGARALSSRSHNTALSVLWKRPSTSPTWLIPLSCSILRNGRARAARHLCDQEANGCP